MLLQTAEQACPTSRVMVTAELVNLSAANERHSVLHFLHTSRGHVLLMEA